MSLLSPTDKLIRKLRKKLRQIERLETLGRSTWCAEEAAKVKQKNKFRKELNELLDQVGQEELSCEEKPENSTPTINKDGRDRTRDQSGECPGCAPHSESPLTDTATEEKTVLTATQDLPPVKVGKREKQTVKPQPTEMKRSSPTSSVPPTTPEKAAESTQKKKPKAQEPAQPPSPSREGKSVQQVKGAEVAKAWHDTPFLVRSLEVHSDIVAAVDVDEDFVLSGSRDTLVQVWDARNGSPLMNLRGHTNAVTCVLLLTARQSADLADSLALTAPPRLALTASSDCCLKLWDIASGTALKSIYTYSAVTALCYLAGQQCCAVGSEGGKLQVYTFLDEHVNPVASINAFEGPVTSIKDLDGQLICSSLDDRIQVWNFDGKELSRLYSSDDLPTRSRPVLSLAPLPDGRFVYGDEGASVKAVAWKTGQVTKVRNHVHEFGLTSALCTTRSFLLCSSINLDTGNSSVNVRSVPSLDYLGTLSVRGMGRIACLSAVELDNGKGLRIAIGGSKLTLLETTTDKRGTHRPTLVKSLEFAADDSDDETASSSSSEDGEAADVDLDVPTDPESSAGPSRCLIL